MNNLSFFLFKYKLQLFCEKLQHLFPEYGKLHRNVDFFNVNSSKFYPSAYFFHTSRLVTFVTNSKSDHPPNWQKKNKICSHIDTSCIDMLLILVVFCTLWHWNQEKLLNNFPFIFEFCSKNNWMYRTKRRVWSLREKKFK